MTSKREQAAAIRRLNKELGIVSARDLALLGLGLLLVLGAIVGLFLALTAERGPAEPTSGVVTGLGFAETESGSQPYASVRVDNRTVRVKLDPGGICRMGDDIALTRRKTGLGHSYRWAAPGCGRPDRQAAMSWSSLRMSTTSEATPPSIRITLLQ